MKNLILFLIFCCVALCILAVINKIRFKRLKNKARYRTPRLSNLHGKDFANYIDYLTEGLK